jgi:AraC-like DNA-binding protein
VAYLSERRIERAQDLLRTSNLTVTEACFAVGYASLGSFSARFTEITGETPRAFQRRYVQLGAPAIPGCYVFMAGLVERRNPGEAAADERPLDSTA